MVQFSDQGEEERLKEFGDLQKKKEEALKEFEQEKEKELEEVRKKELALEALRREKEQAEKKLKSLAEKHKEKSKEIEEDEKKLKEQAEALARKIESEAEELSRLRKPFTQEGLEEVVVQAAQGLPEQPVQTQPQVAYQTPSQPGESSLYQRLAQLRGGIYSVASHRVSEAGEVLDQERSQIGSLYSQLQDIVQNLASHAVQGRKLDVGDATRVTEAFNATMQAVEKLGEAYSGRFENLLNRARGYMSKQDEIYKTPGT